MVETERDKLEVSKASSQRQNVSFPKADQCCQLLAIGHTSLTSISGDLYSALFMIKIASYLWQICGFSPIYLRHIPEMNVWDGWMVVKIYIDECCDNIKPTYIFIFDFHSILYIVFTLTN